MFRRVQLNWVVSLVSSNVPQVSVADERKTQETPPTATSSSSSHVFAPSSYSNELKRCISRKTEYIRSYGHRLSDREQFKEAEEIIRKLNKIIPEPNDKIYAQNPSNKPDSDGGSGGTPSGGSNPAGPGASPSGNSNTGEKPSRKRARGNEHQHGGSRKHTTGVDQTRQNKVKMAVPFVEW